MSGVVAGGAGVAPPLPRLVEYLVARDGTPSRRGLAYDYVLAGDGVFIATENAWLSLRIPVARCAVRGLPPVYAACSLTHGRIPMRLWHDALDAAQRWAAVGQELVLAIAHDPVSGYRLDLPHQLTGATRVVYAPPAQAVMELHSHHTLPARFSRVDDLDEQRLCLYGVIGRLDRPRPHIALRAGAYGHWFPVPWESVFDGGAEERAAVHDAHFDGPDIDELSSSDSADDPTRRDRDHHHEREGRYAGNTGTTRGTDEPDPADPENVFFSVRDNGEGGSESAGGWRLPD